MVDNTKKPWYSKEHMIKSRFLLNREQLYGKKRKGICKAYETLTDN